MKSKVECPFCDCTAFLKYEVREITYKKEPFAVKAHYYQCEKCREEFTMTETDSQTLAQLSRS